jgi:hypothetical protein
VVQIPPIHFSYQIYKASLVVEDHFLEVLSFFFLTSFHQFLWRVTSHTVVPEVALTLGSLILGYSAIITILSKRGTASLALSMVIYCTRNQVFEVLTPILVNGPEG